MDNDLHELIHILVEMQRKLEEVYKIVDKLAQKDASREIHENTIRKMLKNGTTLIDILQVTAMFILLISPFILAGLWWWVWFWCCVLGIFGGFEVLSYIKTGKTLSQQFGAYLRKNRTQGLLILTSMLLGWLVLLWHLL